MEKLKDKLIYSAFGGIGSAAGLISLSRCSANACASCFGCAGIGAGILLAALFNKFRKNKQEDINGMASRNC
ncbi:MAG: hypothetical protein QMD07_01655 [Thermodesulfovibrionales bacterium]|nr:hypothetical protein [Thermodesulfovibrionales bacterium]